MVIPVLTVALGVLFVVGAFIWAACDGHWTTAGLAVALFVTVLVLASQAIGGSQPLLYGLMLGLSLFFAGLMIVLGALIRVLLFVSRND